jgi:hypothetical protein
MSLSARSGASAAGKYFSTLCNRSGAEEEADGLATFILVWHVNERKHNTCLVFGDLLAACPRVVTALLL